MRGNLIDFFNGIPVIQSDYMSFNLNPRTLKDFSIHYGSWLIGIEKYISKKLDFECLVFTSNQKNYLKVDPKEKTVKSGVTLIVGRVTYSRLKAQEVLK